MKKLSEINEGMFSGMVRRSNTDQVKKEDDVDNMDREQFYEYIKNHYISKSFYTPDCFGKCEIYIKIKGGSHLFFNKRPDDTHIALTGSHGFCDSIKNILSQKYDVYPNTYSGIRIAPKDKSEISNSLYIDILNTLIDNIDDIEIKKKVNEGMFSGMVRRSNSDLTKKEDNVDNMDINELEDYIYSHYKFNMDYSQNERTNGFISFPFYKWNMLFINYFNNSITSFEIVNNEDINDKVLESFYDVFDENIVSFDPTGGEIENFSQIKLKDRDITNSECIRVLNKMIDKLGNKLHISRK